MCIGVYIPTPDDYGMTQLECRVLTVLADGHRYTSFGVTVLGVVRTIQFMFPLARYDSLERRGHNYNAVSDALYRLLGLGLVEHATGTEGNGWRLTDDGKQMVDAIRATEDDDECD